MAFELRGQTPQNATPVGPAASNFLRSFHASLGGLSGQSDSGGQPPVGSGGATGSVGPIVEPQGVAGELAPRGSVNPIVDGPRGGVNPIVDGHVMSAQSPDGSIKGYLQPDGSVQFTYNDVPISPQGGDFVGFTPDGKVVYHDPATGQARTEPVGGGQPPATLQPLAPAQPAAPAEPQVHPQTPLFTGQDNTPQPPVAPSAPPEPSAPPAANPSPIAAPPSPDSSAPISGGYMPTLSSGGYAPPADIAPPVDYTQAPSAGGGPARSS